VSLVGDESPAMRDRRREIAGPRVVWLASGVLFGVLPVAILVAHVSDTILTAAVGWDFRTYYDAAAGLLRDGTPYGQFDERAFRAGREYVYPPLTAIAVTPLTVLPPEAAGIFAMSLLLAAVLVMPLAVGVRDWRCIGLVLLWPPVIAGIQTVNVTILLGLAAALAWRFRERAFAAGTMVGTAFAVKLVLWPLAVWLTATRRWAAAACAAVWSIGLLVGSWAVVGFDGLASYPGLVKRVAETFGDHGYTLYAFVLRFGASADVAFLVSLGFAAALVWGVVVTGRRGMDRRAFILGIAASQAVTPIIWLEHFTWLIVVVAVAQPRLGPLWFVPLAMWMTAGTHSPTQVERIATLAVAALTALLALRIPEQDSEQPLEERPRGMVVEAT
jgi:hypothetical protein